MNPTAVTVLGWVCWAAAAFGVIVYFAVLLRRPQWVRLWNGSGLFFVSLALTQGPVIVDRTAAAGAAFSGVIAVLLMIVGVIAQASAGLRNRRAWDGVERRAGEPERIGGDIDRRARSDRRGESDRRQGDRRSGQTDLYWTGDERRDADRRTTTERRSAAERRGPAEPSNDE